ncbi:porin family protein [Rhodobacter sp. Har01]|uniref:outer membrane beta-barrel protein n=1 Tax=Rhodobacter sp. Har01 TaxID=2883999 RepID=UPI001D0963F9|nr:outer membrane beta-barrel protein [Rhodobacter sp. Har01]MCB6179855.1 porin family protein [Rhodobacter sp. Har01]
MRLTLTAATMLLAFTQLATAQDGLYYGVGVGVLNSTSEAPIVPDFEAEATDLSLALTAGYRLSQTGTMFYGVEGNLDLHTGKLMSDGADACTSTSPTWCEVNATARLRATFGTTLSGGSTVMASLGFAAVSGRLEANPGDYRDSVGRGTSVGVSWERLYGAHTVRMDLNYDRINTDDDPTYDRSLDMVGLRVSYMF